MTFEIDDCKFQLKAMTSPDYQPLVDNKRIIEKLQERITLMNIELMTVREHKERIIKNRKALKETEEKRRREKKRKIKKEMCLIYLSCNDPVTGKLTSSFLNVHKDELLPSVLDKAYELMELAPHIPIERCRLVKYNIKDEVMDQSLDLDEFQHQTIGQIAGGARVHSSFKLFLETRKENETFKKYSHGGINLEVSVVDLTTGEVGPAKPMRGEEGWTVEELKQHIGELFNISLSCMRIVLKEKDYQGDLTQDISHVRSTLKNILSRGYRQYEKAHTDTLFSQFYVSSDPEDCQKEFKDSLMYRYVESHVKWIIQLNITIPPGPEATPTTTNVTKGKIIMKIISINEEILVLVDKRITLAQLKEELVPLIGVPPTGFRVCRIGGRYGEYEMEELDKTFEDVKSGSKLIVRLGRALRRGEKRIKLYLIQVNNTEFCKFMMDTGYAKGTPVRELKKQIIEEAKVQGIDCVLELDKMRLRDKRGVSPGSVYLDHERIDDARFDDTIIGKYMYIWNH
ncbi:PREDICTED: ubiquitin carboxyl-terminal hydrolase 47-like [Amphimedon queenslandica]|uniref:Ubiquitin carboxyl-terminal hydrolase 47 C-terminal domain-containing protein n=1 Tax=Amphimedon queenslandica TaxID=400682 RepID=A0AAN0JY00_AMPQE|nr:PREDICTED: ubiquitin carboxyl-terminal hydrolase 47-like [Amphimedon queenslandica]|eukprot:XP_019861800.1 PREDICTED: ubiquitin carboxyl-terminal hydrolase 47-like [Amphimedon queenslandica]